MLRLHWPKLLHNLRRGEPFRHHLPPPDTPSMTTTYDGNCLQMKYGLCLSGHTKLTGSPLSGLSKRWGLAGGAGGTGAVPHSPPPLGVTVSMKEVRGGNDFIDEFCMSWWASTCLTGGCSLVCLASVQARRGVCQVCRYPSCPWSPWPSAPHLVYILHCGFCK